MKYVNGEYYVEVKDHRYKIHPTENTNLRKRDPPQSLRTQYQVQNETQIRKSQKFVENNGKLVVKNYPKKKQPIQQQPKLKRPNCPSCKRNNWLEFDRGNYCQNCEYIINKQKHQIDKEVLRQDHYFSTIIIFLLLFFYSFIYADEKIREIYYPMANTTYNTTQDMINKLQMLKGKTKLKLSKSISNDYDEMNIRRQSGNFQFEDDIFSKTVRGIGKICHEVLL